MITRRLQSILKSQNKNKTIRTFAKKRPMGKRSNVPEYNPVEFEPFKFRNERNQIFSGYTSEELFARNFGEKHSSLVRKEMNKDSIIVIIGILVLFWLATVRKERIQEFEKAWYQYYEDIKEE